MGGLGGQSPAVREGVVWKAEACIQEAGAWLPLF